MERCKQNLLHVFLSESSNWKIPRIQRVFKGVLSALVYLHARHYVHRDIKLSNLLVQNANCVKICDFGCISKIGQLTSANVCGTLSYMPPELFRRDLVKVDACLDVWSFGCCIFMFLMGHQPFAQPNREITKLRIQHGLYTQSAEVIGKAGGIRLNRLLNRMFEANYKNRITSAELLADPFFAVETTVDLNKEISVCVLK